MKYTVCFVTAEMAPHAKAGGLADVSAALTRLLHVRGHRVLPFLPLYADLGLQGVELEPVPALAARSLVLGRHRFDYAVLRGRRGAGLPDLLLVDCPALFGRPGLYGDAVDEHLRFLLLSRAALDSCLALGVRPDIVHCHDWHTALLPLYLKTVYAAEPLLAAARSVFTIHNLGYQGVLPLSAADDLGLGTGVARLDAVATARGQINLLRQGIVDADVVSTVSPTYAVEICTPEQGMGLDDALRGRGDEIAGILNGVGEEWDPRSDPLLPVRYSANDLWGKREMRERLCERLGLEHDLNRPLVGLIARLTWQKGVDLLFSVLPGLVAQRQLSLVVLGAGDPAYESFFTGLAADHPDLVAFRAGHDEELAHWIEAGCDAFLMPSRYEPCGLNQMYSLRYGTVPIVRRTGGLADSVRHFDPATGAGTGIVFNDADAGAVRWALGQMIEWFGDRATWSRLVANGMAEDFGWDVAVDRYLELYARAARR